MVFGRCVLGRESLGFLSGMCDLGFLFVVKILGVFDFVYVCIVDSKWEIYEDCFFVNFS